MHTETVYTKTHIQLKIIILDFQYIVIYKTVLTQRLL
jgi:hypothetical protein